jgi:hypothetical protein
MSFLCLQFYRFLCAGGVHATGYVHGTHQLLHKVCIDTENSAFGAASVACPHCSLARNCAPLENGSHNNLVTQWEPYLGMKVTPS